MSRSARLFVSIVIAGGFGAAIASTLLVRVDHPAGYAAVTALTLLSAYFKVSLSRTGGGSSVSAATGGVFFALLRFGPAAAVPLAVVSVVVQDRVRVSRPNPPVRTAFSAACVVLSALAAGAAHAALGPPLSGITVAGPMAAAATVYFLVNSLLVAGAVGLTRGEPPLRYWRETCLLAAPYFFLSAGGGALAAVTIRRPQEGVLVALFGVPVYLAYRGFRTYLAQLHDWQRETERALAQGLRITEALTLAITAQDGASHEDVQRLQDFGVRLAARSGLDERGQRDVAMAVLLRNIGLLAVPRDVLTKTGALAPAETALIESHPRTSVAMLATAQLAPEVREAIETHHERWDGTGYPRKLAGRDIPLSGRIVGLLDVYDEVAHPRGGLQPRPAGEVIDLLRAEVGGGLDPVLTGMFVDLLQGGAEGTTTVEDISSAASESLALRSRDLALEQVARGRRESELMDPLTGLANRRAVERVIERELERARREGVPLSVLVADIDGFGLVNGAHGHALGDRVLRLIAQTLLNSVRPYDTCARIGGDAFAVVFPRCSADVAAGRCRHLADTIAGLELPSSRGPVRVTISAAASTYPVDADGASALLDAAVAVLEQQRQTSASGSAGHAA